MMTEYLGMNVKKKEKKKLMLEYVTGLNLVQIPKKCHSYLVMY